MIRFLVSPTFHSVYAFGKHIDSSCCAGVGGNVCGGHRYFAIQSPQHADTSSGSAGFLYHVIAPAGLGTAYSLSGLMLGFLVLIVPYALGGIGAGDVKFLAGIGAWVGPQAILSIVLIGCIATGLYSAIVIVHCRGLKGIVANVRFLVHSLVAHVAGPAPSTASVQAIAREPDRRERLVPFSAMLAIGVWCVIITDWYTG